MYREGKIDGMFGVLRERRDTHTTIVASLYVCIHVQRTDRIGIRIGNTNGRKLVTAGLSDRPRAPHLLDDTPVVRCPPRSFDRSINPLLSPRSPAVLHVAPTS